MNKPADLAWATVSDAPWKPPLRGVFQACPIGRRLRGRSRTHRKGNVTRLAWESLGIFPEELEEVSRKREVCLRPYSDRWAHIRRRWTDLKRTLHGYFGQTTTRWRYMFNFNMPVCKPGTRHLLNYLEGYFEGSLKNILIRSLII